MYNGPAVRVKDLISYLSRFNPEANVWLDKDGWMEKDMTAENPVDLIRERGLFSSSNGSLIINN